MMTKTKAKLAILLTVASSLVHLCSAFCTPNSYYRLSIRQQKNNAIQRKNSGFTLPLFRELVTDEDEDLRADISIIRRQEGLDDFLKMDDRLCVIKLYAPYCKACKAFGVKFRMLANEKGDGINAAGEAVRKGHARFGEIDYASNVKMCKNLGVKKFPTVLIFRGQSTEKLSEILCKKTAIEDIAAEIDSLVNIKVGA